jgi:hypothetical protein
MRRMIKTRCFPSYIGFEVLGDDIERCHVVFLDFFVVYGVGSFGVSSIHLVIRSDFLKINALFLYLLSIVGITTKTRTLLFFSLRESCVMSVLCFNLKVCCMRLNLTIYATLCSS